MTKRVRVTGPTVIKVNTLLQEHMNKGVDDPYWRYDEDWSDARIAREVGHDLTADHVARIRRDFNMKLPPYRSAFSRLIEAHNDLCDVLSERLNMNLDKYKYDKSREGDYTSKDESDTE